MALAAAAAAQSLPHQVSLRLYRYIWPPIPYPFNHQVSPYRLTSPPFSRIVPLSRKKLRRRRRYLSIQRAASPRPTFLGGPHGRQPLPLYHLPLLRFPVSNVGGKLPTNISPAGGFRVVHPPSQRS